MNKNRQDNKIVQFVVKSSKFCNLRCRYCYEYADLGKRESISLEQLDQMYTNIASYYSLLDQPTTIEFVWHGGEPLLQDPDYYWRTFDRQQQIFGDLAPFVRNTVQTNLTVLSQKHLYLLREGFDGVGVSVDLFGGLRVRQSGQDSLPTVLANMDKLREQKIRFGCITVLTKANLAYIEAIYKFYKELGVTFRILPLFNGAFSDQHEGYEISTDDVVSALCQLFDLWIADRPNLLVCRPIDKYVYQVFQYYTPNAEPNIYDKRSWEFVYLVNVNGDLYSYADAYNSEMSHGNVFTTSMKDIVGGAKHNKVIAAAENRMASACHKCKYFGSCDGYPVAEESPTHNQVDTDGTAHCRKEKKILSYIEQRFQQIGIINPITRQLNRKSLPDIVDSQIFY